MKRKVQLLVSKFNAASEPRKIFGLIATGAGRQVLSGVATLATLSMTLDFAGQSQFAIFANTLVLAQMVNACIGSIFYGTAYRFLNDRSFTPVEICGFLRLLGLTLLAASSLCAVCATAIYAMWTGSAGAGFGTSASLCVLLTIAGTVSCFPLGRERFAVFNFAEIVPAITTLAATIVFKPTDAGSIIWLYICGLGAKIAAIYWFEWKISRSIDVRSPDYARASVHLREFLTAGLHLGFAGASQAMSLRLLYFTILANTSDANKSGFATAWQLAEKSLVITGAANAILFGKIGKQRTGGAYFYAAFQRLLLLVWAGVFIALAGLGSYVWFKEFYLLSPMWAGLLPIYCVVALLIGTQALKSLIVNGLLAIGHTRVVWANAIVLALAALPAALTPKWNSHYWAAWAAMLLAFSTVHLTVCLRRALKEAPQSV